MKTLAKILTAAALLALAPGCALVKPVTPETGHYYINPKTDFSQVGRVVILELDNETRTRDLARPVTEALAQAVQKRHLYSVRVLSEKDPRWIDLDLESADFYTIDDMAQMHRKLDADAVIFGRITQHYTYPRMLIGLHLKMIDLNQGSVIWGLEQVWDTTDKRTEERMRAFFDREMREGYEPYHWELVITSPRAFQKFIVYEIARTLPESSGYFRVTPEYPASYRGYYAGTQDYIDLSRPAESTSYLLDNRGIRHKKH